MIALIYYFSNEHLSDLKKTKEKNDGIKLANYSTAISKSEAANRVLEKQIDRLKTAPIDTTRLRGVIDGGNTWGK